MSEDVDGAALIQASIDGADWELLDTAMGYAEATGVNSSASERARDDARVLLRCAALQFAAIVFAGGRAP